MTPAQKIIKNLALAFACFLIFSIISGILGTLYALSGVLGLQRENKKINAGIGNLELNIQNNKENYKIQNEFILRFREEGKNEI